MRPLAKLARLADSRASISTKRQCVLDDCVRIPLPFLRGMEFNSLTFLCFFAIVLALHNLPIPWKIKKFNLLVASYIFYSAWNPPFVLLLMLATVVDWFAAKGLYRARTPRARRGWLLLTLISNLGMLAFFKYGDFLQENFVSLLQVFNIDYSPAKLGLMLPIGISFYTFVTLSYTLDVYFGKMKPWDSFLDYAMLVTFFPHLVAGPILRAIDFLPQCQQERRPNADQFSLGLCLFILGIFEKVVIADQLCAPIVEAVFNAGAKPGFVDAWMGAFAFAAQIFCDFAGYSTAAIGIACTLGFEFPRNFNFPYAAVGFSDFWRRWHISLSSWLRDYLYIPLGGNRKGPRRTQINLLLTMVLGGLWHGAAWTFVIWGALHGLYLIAERHAQRLAIAREFWARPAGQFLLGLLTFALVCVAWVFFRASGVASAWQIAASMLGLFQGATGLLSNREVVSASVITIGMLGIHWAMRNRPFIETASAAPWAVRSIGLAVMLTAIGLAPASHRAFIYFQF